MIDFNDYNNNISDEMLAAYIDGNATENEKSLIENSMPDNSMLSEAVDIANDTTSFGSNFDLDLHDGDYGFWELGLPPVLSEEDIINELKNTDNMAEHKNYGYEPNNEIDTFDPNIWQGNQPTCAIRSQEIILRDYGIYHTQDDLVEFATKNGWFNPDPDKGGTDKYAVGNILDACGIPTTRTDNATIYDIISELKAGHRVIVSVDADELWVRKKPNLFKRVIAQVTNKANDTIQNFLGLEGANHALVVAGVNVNPQDPSDIKVTLIDSGTGDVCIEYGFKDFHDAWSDGHCRMISTDIPAPFQYNYHTHQIEPSNIATSYAPSMIQAPDGLTNQFRLTESFYDENKDFTPEYNEANLIMIDGVDESVSNQDSEIDDSTTDDNVQLGCNVSTEEEQHSEDMIDNDMQDDTDSFPTLNDDAEYETSGDEFDFSSSENNDDEFEDM